MGCGGNHCPGEALGLVQGTGVAGLNGLSGSYQRPKGDMKGNKAAQGGGGRRNKSGLRQD